MVQCAKSFKLVMLFTLQNKTKNNKKKCTENFKQES